MDCTFSKFGDRTNNSVCRFKRFHATARKGSVSRIVPVFREGTVVTTPRSDTHYVVTEFGTTDLKGKSVKQRALAIIELAHPQFRDELRRESERLHLV